MELTCRVCLQVEELMVHIYDEVEDLHSDLSTLLEQCGGLKVEKNDRFPKYLCKECTSELLIAAKFREKCTHSQEILQQVEADLQTAAAQEQLLLEVPAEGATTRTDTKQTEFQQHKSRTDPFLTQLDDEPINDLEDAQQQDFFLEQAYEYMQEVEVEGSEEPTLKLSSIDCAIEPVIDESLEDDIGELVVHVEESAEEQIDSMQAIETAVEINTPCTEDGTLLQFECNLCGAGFKYATNLRRHLEKTHMSLQLYRCELCGYCCTSEQQCTQHCDNCEGAKTRSVAKLHSEAKRKSKATHTGRKKTNMRSQSGDNTCSYCGKQLQSQFALNMHLRTHTGDRPYACEFCDKAFKTQSALTTHLKRHAGLPDYACDVCGKKFYETSNLAAHKRTHTGDRPHKCRICGKCFTRVFLLQLHLRTHTKEKPYQCNQCERAFAQTTDLKNHIRTHSGERRFRCPACPRTFNRKQALLVHLKKHHPLDAVLENTTVEQIIEESVDPCALIEYDSDIKLTDCNSDDLDANTTQVLHESLSLSDMIDEDCIARFITPCQ